MTTAAPGPARSPSRGLVVRARVLGASWRDSVALMRVAAELRAHPGVTEAAALMGTPANRDILAAAGLGTPDTLTAGPGDLMLVVAAADSVTTAAALDAAEAALAGGHDAGTGRPGRRRADAGSWRPRTVAGAARALPGATLAAISVPGAYAAREARAALALGLHVFLFSDNVSLSDELALKREARQRGLLCLGPDCGTAYVGGVGLGFANVVRRGRIGLVAASGTGLQAIASGLDALGEGISHGLGVGGRDLSEEVGGIMALAAIEALGGDAGTEAIVVVSKPPAPAVLPRLGAALAAAGKPAVVCCLGAAREVAELTAREIPELTACEVAELTDGKPRRLHAHVVETLDAAARAAAALVQGRVVERPLPFSDPADVRRRLARCRDGAGRRGASLIGLYTGGTLAHEARLVLAPHVGAPGTALDGAGHAVVDLGDDRFTVGRPHPMLDPEARAAVVRAQGGRETVGILLLDLVLGQGAHPDPAGPVAAAVEAARAEARRRGRELVAVASVVGTAGDPQGLAAQIARLEAAGVEVLPSNAEAARYAALLASPAAAGALLAGAA